MPEDVFLTLLNTLHTNGFRGRISFNGFSEPFYNIGLVKQRVSQIRELFGYDVEILFNTNGDFVTVEGLNGLDVDILNIMDYDGRGLDYIRQKFAEWNIMVGKLDTKDNVLHGMHIDVQKIRYRSDFLKYMRFEDRGGFFRDDVVVDGTTLKWKNDRRQRREPCAQVGTAITIAYNGNVTLCTNVRSDNPEHHEHILGNIKEEDLLGILYKPTTQAYFRMLRSSDYDNYPEACRHCQKGIKK